ncbi:MAG: hypothetical protein ACLR2O_03255 [Coprococcus sp.]
MQKRSDPESSGGNSHPKKQRPAKSLPDMSGDNQRQIILKGGRDGLGNQHFATSTMQVPKYAQPGQPAQGTLGESGA